MLAQYGHRPPNLTSTLSTPPHLCNGLALCFVGRLHLLQQLCTQQAQVTAGAGTINGSRSSGFAVAHCCAAGVPLSGYVSENRSWQHGPVPMPTAAGACHCCCFGALPHAYLGSRICARACSNWRCFSSSSAFHASHSCWYCCSTATCNQQHTIAQGCARSQQSAVTEGQGAVGLCCMCCAAQATVVAAVGSLHLLPASGCCCCCRLLLCGWSRLLLATRTKGAADCVSVYPLGWKEAEDVTGGSPAPA